MPFFKKMRNPVVVAMTLFACASITPSVATEIKPSSNAGQFDATINNDHVIAELRVKYVFQDGNRKKIPGFPRDVYQWKDQAERDDFKRSFTQIVEAAWSSKFSLVSLDAGNPKTLSVELRVIEDNSNPQWHILAEHYPMDVINPDSSVCDPGFKHPTGAAQKECDSHAGSYGTLLISNSHVAAIDVADEAITPEWMNFELGKDSLTTDTLKEWSHGDNGPCPPDCNSFIGLLAGGPPWMVQVVGYAVEDEVQHGDDVVSLARRRAAEATAYLTARGVPPESVQTVISNPFDPENDQFAGSAWIDVTNSRQQSFVHEVGHMIGLGDEVIIEGGCKGRPLTGHNASYADMVESWGFEKPVQENTASIMSTGSAVMPRHYTPFLEAVWQITGSIDWTVCPVGADLASCSPP